MFVCLVYISGWVEKPVSFGVSFPSAGSVRKNIGTGKLIGVLDVVLTLTDGEHVLWIDESRGFHVQCDLRYINHSEEPNAVYYDTLCIFCPIPITDSVLNRSPILEHSDH
jgi:hypothetical protein